MDVTYAFEYVERNVIPPRCRKPRDVYHSDGTVTVHVGEVTPDDAPVAFRVDMLFSQWATELRWHNETLFEPYLPWSGQVEASLPGSKFFPAEQPSGYRTRGMTHDEAIEHLHEQARTFLIVDGVVWVAKDGEPRYVIHTQGLGGNHGGTSIGVDYWYNSNIGRDRYFRADQFDEARAAAIDIATRRGDTISAAGLVDQEPDIEVLIPEAVRCDPPNEGGDGDPFLNKLYAVSEAAGGDTLVAGFGALAVLAHEMKDT